MKVVVKQSQTKLIIFLLLLLCPFLILAAPTLAAGVTVQTLDSAQSGKVTVETSASKKKKRTKGSNGGNCKRVLIGDTCTKEDGTVVTPAAPTHIKSPPSQSINQTSNWQAVYDLISRVGRDLVVIAGASVLLLYLWAALLFITAGSNRQKVWQAKQQAYRVTIGLAVIAGVYTLQHVIVYLVGAQ